LARVAGTPAGTGDFGAVYARLRAELAAQRVGELRAQVRSDHADVADETFAALVQAAQERQRLARLFAGPGLAPERAAPA
jgi:hypothetical protein